MVQSHKNIYCFLSDANNQYYVATKESDGTWTVSTQSTPFPLRNNPKNLTTATTTIGTNKTYFSLNVGVIDPLEFIEDGTAILRERYNVGMRTQEYCYLTVIQFNGVNRYDLVYKGKIDFANKVENIKNGVFTVPTIDDSAWGVLSQKDKNVYSVPCNSTNKKAIRVLFDGITLLNKITYQAIQTTFGHDLSVVLNLFPVSIINQNGDTVDTVVKNASSSVTHFNIVSLRESSDWIFHTYKSINNVRIYGSISFIVQNAQTNSGISIYFCTNFLKDYNIALIGTIPGYSPIINGFQYNFSFDFSWNLDEGEKIFFGAESLNPGHPDLTITTIATNIFIETKTIQSPQVAWGVRSLDLAQQLVNQATDGRFTIGSEFLTNNNRDVILSGDSLRNVKNASIYSSFEDFFKTMDCVYYMAMRSINGNLFIEKATTVYDTSTNIINFEEAQEVNLSPALEYLAGEITIGNRNQDLRHPSGRLEFNCEAKFNTPLINIDSKLEILSPYRLGCYDAQFLILDYLGGSTQDNLGDKSVYMVRIDNQKETVRTTIENFEIVNISNVLLEPLIKTPYSNDLIAYQYPTLTGIAIPSTLINIYCDKVLDGSVTSDSNGNWTYNVVNALSTYTIGVYTGVHIIEATYGTLQDPVSSITITVDISLSPSTSVVYPIDGDEIPNPYPFIYGETSPLNSVSITLDSSFITSVTADNSGKWSYQIPFGSPISEGSHVLDANGAIVNFSVKVNLECPVITYIGSQLDGFPIINNLPLIKGTAKPGSSFNLYLNYISYNALNDTTPIVADADGYWEFQVVPVNYTDPVSGSPIVLAPIRNGQSSISTDLLVKNAYVNVTGYKLERPDYAPITGVTDNTVFNTAYSPKRMLMARFPLFAGMLSGGKITYQSSSKNGNLVTSLIGGETIHENTDELYSSLGTPIALLEYANIKVSTKKSFVNILKDFNNGGVMLFTFKGNIVPVLPIGKLSMNNMFDSTKELQCLVAPTISYTTLLSLYKTGLKIEVMNGAIYHSDYNSLHAVEINYPDNPKYNQVGIYEDWFENRNSFWDTNPEYIQKYNTCDVIVDQIISNGILSIYLDVYRCIDAKVIDTIEYTPISPNPLSVGDVRQAEIDFSNYPEDQYFFVIRSRAATNLNVVVSGITSHTVQSIFSGNMKVGDVVYISYTINGTTYNFISTILSSWISSPISFLVTDFYNKMTVSGLFISIVLSSFSGSGLDTITADVGTGNTVSFSWSSANERNSAITERVQTKVNWDKTILIESSNSSDFIEAFFSSGFSTKIRVEGIVEKLDFDVNIDTAKDDISNSKLLYSTVDKKRLIRYGNARGIPDYLSLKISMAMSLDQFKTERVQYVLAETPEKSEAVNGHPMFYYTAKVFIQNSVRGAIFPGKATFDRDLLPISVDPTAFGLPAGSTLNINVE